MHLMDNDSVISDNTKKNLDTIRDFFVDGVWQVRDLAKENPGLDGFSILMERRAEIIDINIAEIARAAAGEGKKSACRRGCSFCCFQDVFVTTSELAYIAIEMRKRPERMAVAATRTREVFSIISDLPPGERYVRGISCPFLEDRECSIYEFRPSVCNAYISISKVACQRDWKNKRRRRKDLKAIPFIGETSFMALAIAMSMDAVLLEMGKKMGRYEIAGGLSRMLEPGAVEAWWENSGDPLAGLPEGECDGAYEARLKEGLMFASAFEHKSVLTSQGLESKDPFLSSTIPAVIPHGRGFPTE